jgi:mono/diheme cytochrome c family protein
VSRIIPIAVLGTLALVVAGCASSEPEVSQFDLSKKVETLSPKLRKQIRAILTEHCGTATVPKLLGQTKADPKYPRLLRGAAVYARNCRACHGATGDGNGPVAALMYPRPRDYRPGIFKFTSTTYGSKPLRDDLLRTVRRGIRGTSMPSFHLMEPDDQEAVVDYVLALTHRGELEAQLAEEAELNDEIGPDLVPGMIETVLGRWKEARGQVVLAMTVMPEFTAERVRTGKAVFLSKGCYQCHGEDGRGQTKENIGTDAWGFPTKAADLTSGMLRGGTEPLDIYRHIDAGINGTPMPAFHSAFEKEPDAIWNLTAYVLFMANRRRNGEILDAGLLKPFPGVETKTNASGKPLASLDRQ